MNRAVPAFHQMEQPPKYADRHFFMVQPQLLQNRGMKVAIVMGVFDGLIPEFVGRAVHRPTLNTAPGQPRRKALRIMVPPCRIL